MNPPCTPTDSYGQQLQQKVDDTLEEFSGFGVNDIDVFASPVSGYRMRAEFKIWHDGDDIAYTMFGSDQGKTPYSVQHFSPGSTRMQALMDMLLPLLRHDVRLRHRLFQVEFLTTTINEAVVSLIYHKKLDQQWQQAAEALADRLDASVLGRSRKQKVIIGRDHAFEQFNVSGQVYRYQQLEGPFTQPNAAVCQSMLNWVDQRCSVSSPRSDLLELYCGNGNFTLPLSRHFDKVLATEIAKSSIKSAQLNCQINNIDNIHFVRMSSEELTQALNGTRPFRRLQDIDLADFDFSTVFVDPPRAGLDTATTELLSRFDRIIYISCNPETLKRDLERLRQTHSVERMALFDQFPYTKHRECGAVLSR